MQTTDRTPLNDAEPAPDQAQARRRARRLAIMIAVAGVVLDQATKVWAIVGLEPNRPVPVLGPVLQLRLIRNPGAAFSLGESITPVFAILAILVLGFISIVLLPKVVHRGWAVALGLMCAGVTGNLIDRLFRPPGVLRGHVVDFLELPRWPIFNVADMCVTSAAVLIVVLTLFVRRGLDGR